MKRLPQGRCGGTSRCRARPGREEPLPRPRHGRSAADEVDHDFPGVALQVLDLDRFAIAAAQLVEQRQRVVIVDEAHALAGIQRVERTENGGVAKALGDPARVEGVDLVLAKMQMSVHGCSYRCKWNAYYRRGKCGSARLTAAASLPRRLVGVELVRP